MSDEGEVEYGLVMPFVTVHSKGGPHEDNAYAAGWEMGVLDETLKAKPVFHEQIIRTDSTAQADLIAMKNGYRPEIVRIDTYWSSFTAARLDAS